MTDRHTPGPWHANTPEDGDHCQDVTIREPLRGAVVAVSMPSIYDDGDTPPEQWKANARLIAAAPDLLDVCRQFVRARSDINSGGWTIAEALRSVEDAARAAIAKVEGRHDD